MNDKQRLHGADLARRIADLCDEKKAQDIEILDMSRALGVTDYFVICSGTNARQCRIIAEHCDQHVKDSGGFRQAPMEGKGEGSWICADFGDVVLHVFLEETRRFYDLENKWGDAPRLEWAPAVPVEERVEDEEDEEGWVAY